ncbi:hypothetical protein DBR06_SOUSAS3910030, partial [Sousa chinensis]
VPALPACLVVSTAPWPAPLTPTGDRGKHLLNVIKQEKGWSPQHRAKVCFTYPPRARTKAAEMQLILLERGIGMAGRASGAVALIPETAIFAERPAVSSITLVKAPKENQAQHVPGSALMNQGGRNLSQEI